MTKFLKDFREFAVKGNVIDLAIGIIIGTAFNKIIQSLVHDVIMPPFGLLWGDKDFTKYKWVLEPGRVDAEGTVIAEEVAITFGNFLAVTVDFLIVALVVFMVIKLINATKRKAEDPQNTEVPTPKDIQLLTEIRDLLSKGKRD